jgi:hypothetical protein
MRDERFRLLIDVRVLLVGADYILPLPHRVSIGLSSGARLGSQSNWIPN